MMQSQHGEVLDTASLHRSNVELQIRVCRAAVQLPGLSTRCPVAHRRLECCLLQVDKLQQQKKILLRNISSIFKTAQEEGRRKDAIIKELRMQQWQSAAQQAQKAA